MAGQDLAALDQPGDRGCHANLPRLAAKLRNACVERLGAAFQCVDRKGSASDCGSEYPLTQEQGVEGKRCAGLSPVDERQAFLGRQFEGLEADLVQNIDGRHRTAHVDPAVTHQRRNKVSQRREVATSPDAALRGDDGHRIMIEQRLQGFDHDRPHTRMTAAEAEQLQHDHQPHHVAREGVAEPGAVRQDQVGLQLGKAVVRNTRVGEETEAGVDAVDRLATGDDALDRSGSVGDPLHRRVVEAHGRSGPDVTELVEGDHGRVKGEAH